MIMSNVMKYINEDAAEFIRVDERNYDLFWEKDRLSDFESWSLSRAVRALFTKETTEWWYNGGKYTVEYRNGGSLDVMYELMHTTADNLVLMEFNEDLHMINMYNLKMK